MRRVSFALTTLDAQMLPPVPGLDDSVAPPWLNGKLEYVAVVRLFGVTQQGASVCAHVHGFKPFFYAEVDGDVASSLPTDAQFSHLAALAELIQSRVSRAGRAKARVVGLRVEWRRSVYGLHLSSTPFLRVELADWHDIEVAAAVLQRGEVPGLGCAQAYDAHLPFLLQFLAQHHVSGAGHVRVSGYFRDGSPTQLASKTSCRIELDVCAPDGVLNHGEYFRLLQGSGDAYSDLARTALHAMLDAPDSRKVAARTSKDEVKAKRPTPGARTPLKTRHDIRDWLLGGACVPYTSASRVNVGSWKPLRDHSVDTLSKVCDIEDLGVCVSEVSRDGAGSKLQQPAADAPGAFYSNLADDPKAPANSIEQISESSSASATLPKPMEAAFCGPKDSFGSGKAPCVSKENVPSPKHDSSIIGSRVDWEDLIAVISIEVLCESSKSTSDAWDPTSDKVALVAYCLRSHGCVLGGQMLQRGLRKGAIVVAHGSDQVVVDISSQKDEYGEIHVVQNEDSLMQKLIELIQVFDPDVCLGWEIRGHSWGFLLQRAHALGRTDLRRALSRAPADSSVCLPSRRIFNSEVAEKVFAPENRRQGNRGADPQNYDSEMIAPSELQLPGRLLLNVWRVLMHITFGTKLRSYQPQEVAKEILGETYPLVNAAKLSQLWRTADSCARLAVLKHVQYLSHLSLKILDVLDVLPRAAELSRLFGMDVMSGFTRGTQLRVESLLMRVANAAKFSLFSASQMQVRQQPALECLPLVMEPISGFHWDPVLVLDFKGMYPSLIIANNISFDTCMGRTRRTGLGPTCSLGVRSKPWELDKDQAKILADKFDKRVLEDANVDSPVRLSPSGCLFVAPEVHRGLLPLMLAEVVRLRCEAKAAMKTASGAVARRLDQRQFALKYFANVTYGYAGASFSGRMPCAEVADSIVACGRRALEEATEFIESSEPGAKVIYGDTDSLFVRLQGRSLEEAFAIGRSLCTKISARHPHPVELEFEKVYFPCLCLSKKRYAGLAYTKPPSESGSPAFEAKGIEAVRRDQCRLGSNVQRDLLEIIFKTRDLSAVKQRFLQHVSKLLHGKIDGPVLTDLVFSREARLGTYRAEDEDGGGATLPPQAVVAKRQIATEDAIAGPEFGDRVAYVVCRAPPRTRLADRCVSPIETAEGGALGDTSMHVDRWWYVEKALLPAVARVFHNDLCGLPRVDVASWLRDVVRPSMLGIKGPLKSLCKRLCRKCQSVAAAGNSGFCSNCATAEDLKAVSHRFKQLQVDAEKTRAGCASCAGDVLWKICSAAAYCPVFSRRIETEYALKEIEDEARCLGVDININEVVCISDSEASDRECHELLQSQKPSETLQVEQQQQQIKVELLDDRGSEYLQEQRRAEADIPVTALPGMRPQSLAEKASSKQAESLTTQAFVNVKSESFGQQSASSGEPPVVAARDAAVTTPLCPGHREPCKKIEVKKEGPNVGRFFFACGRSMGDQCKFFAWADQPQRRESIVQQVGSAVSSAADNSHSSLPTTPRRKRQNVQTQGSRTPRKRSRLVSKDGRLAPYIAKPNKRIRERIDRAFEHRLLLISAKHSSQGTISCEVMGHTGNVYDVSLGARVQCSCLDFAKTTQTCKHLVFVLLRVLKLPQDDPRVWQRALLPREMRDLRDRLDQHLRSPSAVDLQAPIEVVTALNAADRVMREQLGSPCPVCLDIVTHLVGTTYCPLCGCNFHVDCLEQLWNAGAPESNSCPSCKRQWPNDVEIACKTAQRIRPGGLLPWRINLASESDLHANLSTLEETYPNTHQWIAARSAEKASSSSAAICVSPVELAET